MWMRRGLPVVAVLALLPGPAEAQRGLDGDRDGVADHLDNCAVVPNPNQLNWDRDAFGDRLQDALSSPSAVAFVVALMQRLATQVGQPQLQAELGSLAGRLPQCVGDLEAKGFVIPEELVVAP